MFILNVDLDSGLGLRREINPLKLMLDELILKNQTQAVDLVICSAEYASEELPFDLEYLIVVPEVVARSCFEGAPETCGQVDEG